jgi:UDP-glucuronate 4-epimerase
MKEKTILVTGGAGFIGSNYIEDMLKSSKVKVITIDNLSLDIKDLDKKINMATFIDNKNFVFIEGDIKDKVLIDEVFDKYKPEVVVHFAAKADARYAVLHPQEYIDTNITGTLNLLEASKNNLIKKFIFISSSSVYGNKNKVPFEETMQADFSISPYGASKKAGEVLCHTYAHNFNLPIVCIRVFNAYGERMRPNLVMYKWVENIINDNEVEMSGTGSRKRDFTYVGDIVKAVNKAISKEINYEIINIGNSDPISLKALLKTIEKILGKKAIIKVKESHKSSVEKTYASVKKAKRILGWAPSTSLEEGLTNFVSWYKVKNS